MELIRRFWASGRPTFPYPVTEELLVIRAECSPRFADIVYCSPFCLVLASTEAGRAAMLIENQFREVFQ